MNLFILVYLYRTTILLSAGRMNRPHSRRSDGSEAEQERLQEVNELSKEFEKTFVNSKYDRVFFIANSHDHYFRIHGIFQIH